MNAWITDAAVDWLQLILFERFGQNFILRRRGEGLMCLGLVGSQKEILFDERVGASWGADSNIPCVNWCPSMEGWDASCGPDLPVPGVEQLPDRLIEESENGYRINYALFGLLYWVLSRKEEIGRTDLDEHGRFPATASHAFKNGYLNRPIADEWLGILGQVIRLVWPNLDLKRHQFGVKISHDVDRPARYAFSNGRELIRAVAGDVARRGDVLAPLKAPWVRLHSRQAIHNWDYFNTFDWLMSVSERVGLVSAFYFICGRSDPRKDGNYEIEDRPIRELMRRIHARGHEIGLHPSYNTFRNPDEIAAEAQRLRRVCLEENIQQEGWGGRMHYLRWESPTTMWGWEQAGMTYDSTLGYADQPGFRCGTCFEYPAFDPCRNRRLELRIRPLIAMEGTILSKSYLGLGIGEKAFEKFRELKEACRAVDGLFTLLWHNSELGSVSARNLYEQVLYA